MKYKNIYGTINIDIFDTKIKWFIGDFNDFIKKYNLEDQELEYSIGLTISINNYILMYSDGTDNLNTIPHETIHAVSRMSDHRDLLFNIDNSEMIAYLVGYISGKILGNKLLNYESKRIN